MLIRVGFDIAFDSPRPVPMVLMLDTRPEWDASIVRPGQFRTEPEIPVETFVDSFGNRGKRLLLPAGQVRLIDDAVFEDSGRPDASHPEAIQHPVETLPPEVLPFLLSSRYCEVDRLSDIAWNLFANAPTGWGRVQAVCDWVHNHVKFGYHFARSTKTAFDAYTERAGVCRDFTHLAVTLCRCLNIPARYSTGYLGDIGVPLADAPMDFSAWFEVFLGGRWHTFDARHNIPRIGRIVMARGRDAVDVALTTSFGPSTLKKFVVWTDEVQSADAN